MEGRVLGSFDGRAAFDGLVAARSAPAVEPVGVDAVQLARDVLLAEQEFRRSGELLSGEAAAEEGRERSFLDFVKGAGLGAFAAASITPWGTLGKLSRAARAASAGADVFGAARAVESAGDVAPVRRVYQEVDSPFGRATEMSAEDALNFFAEVRGGAVAEGSEQIRMFNLSSAGARLALFNAGKNPSDDLGRFVVSEFTDFSIDPKNFPYSEDFLSVYRLSDGVPQALASRVEDLDVELFALGNEVRYGEGGDVYSLLQDDVRNKMRIGKYESENYPRFFPAFRGRTPSYGPFISDDDALMLIRDSVAMDALAQNAANRASKWGDFYHAAGRLSLLDESRFGNRGLVLAAKEMQDFVENSVPGAMVVDRIADALRIVFEPRIGPDTRHLLRVQGNTSKPEFLWFGLFNNRLAIQRLEEVKSMLPSVSYSADERALNAAQLLRPSGGEYGLTFGFRNMDASAMMPSREIRGNLHNLEQNPVAGMFRQLLGEFYDSYYGAGLADEDIAKISEQIDAITTLLRDEGALFEKMVTRGFSNLRPVRTVSVTRVEGIEPFANTEIINHAASGRIVAMDEIAEAIAEDDLQVPAGIISAVLRGYEESADVNPIVSVFSPFADADLAGSPLYAARLVRASDTEMTAFYFTSSSDLREGPHATMARVREVTTPLSESDSYTQAANLSYDVYNTKLNQDVVNGWTVPSTDANVNLASRRELAVVVKHIPTLREDGDVLESVAEVEWYRLFNTEDEAKKWAVARGNREIVDVRTSNFLEIEEPDVEDVVLRISDDFAEGYFLPNYKRGQRDISVTLDAPENYDAELRNTLWYRDKTGRPSGMQSKGVWMDTIAKIQGFDGLPSVVDSFEYGQLLRSGWRPVFRGVKPTILETRSGIIPSGAGWRRQSSGGYAKRYSGDDYFVDFTSGEYSSGRGIYSAGYYFAEEFGTALTYAANQEGVVVAGLLPPYANMAPTSFGQFFWQLDDDYKLALIDEAASVARNNPEMILAMMGYDGAYTNVAVRGGFTQLGRRPEMVLYNRSMMAVYEKPIRAQDFNTSIARAVEFLPDLKENYERVSSYNGINFTWISENIGPKMPDVISDGAFDVYDMPRAGRDVSEWTIQEIT